MHIQGLYAAVFVKNIAASSSFYAKVLGRAPDDMPRPNLVQWRGYGNAGIQQFQDAAKAGRGIMTLVVPDMAATQALQAGQGIAIDTVQQGGFGKISHLSAPDGNLLTLAEPPSGA